MGSLHSRSLDRVASRVTDEIASRLCADGREVLRLSGYPNASMPDDLLEAARESVGVLTQPPSQGLMGLREAISDELAMELGYRISPDEILITNGAMHALSLVFQTLIAPGDGVLIFSPCYFYHGPVELNGGIVQRVPLVRENGYAFDFERMESAITPQTRFLLLNSPVNPTGYVMTRQDIGRLIALVERHNLVVISDEVYHAFTYDGRSHLSLLSAPELRSRTVMIRSFTKSYGLHVWRTGFLTAPLSTIREIANLLEWNVLGLSYLNQRTAEIVLRSPREWLAILYREMEHTRNIMTAGVQAISDTAIPPPQGGCFLFVDTSHIGLDDTDIAAILLDQFGIPCTPGSSHFHPNAVRIPYGGSRAVVEDAVTRIQEAFRFLLAGELSPGDQELTQ